MLFINPELEVPAPENQLVLPPSELVEEVVPLAIEAAPPGRPEE